MPIRKGAPTLPSKKVEEKISVLNVEVLLSFIARVFG
jgi:hypothetical protein